MKPVENILHPGRGVGVIEIGRPVALYLEQGYLKPEETDLPFKMFKFFDDERHTISVMSDESGLVDSISCFETVTLNGNELINRTEQEIEATLGAPEEIEAPQEMPDGTLITDWVYWTRGYTVQFTDGVSISVSVDEPVLDDN